MEKLARSGDDKIFYEAGRAESLTKNAHPPSKLFEFGTLNKPCIDFDSHTNPNMGFESLKTLEEVLFCPRHGHDVVARTPWQGPL